MSKAQMNEGIDKEAYAKAAAIARYVDLSEVRLQSVTSVLEGQRDALIRAAPWHLHLRRNMSCSYKEESKILTVVAKLGVDVSPEGEAVPLDSLKINCIYHLDYLFNVTGGPKGKEQDEYFLAFSRVNGLYNIWPYFREFVQSICSRSGMPPIVLPVYRVSPTPNNNKESTDAQETARRQAASPSSKRSPQNRIRKRS